MTAKNPSTGSSEKTPEPSGPAKIVEVTLTLGRELFADGAGGSFEVGPVTAKFAMPISEFQEEQIANLVATLETVFEAQFSLKREQHATRRREVERGGA